MKKKIILMCSMLLMVSVAAKAYTEPGTDFTSMVSNPEFGSNVSGWTNTTGKEMKRSTVAKGDGTVITADGGHMQVWQSATGKIYQTVTGLPTGTYKLQAGLVSTGTVYLYAGTNKTSAVSSTGSYFEVTGHVSNGSLEIGLELSSGTIEFDHVTLTFVSPQINDDASASSWTSTSSTGNFYAGSYVQLDGLKMTFGISSDANTNWTWNGGNSGMLPSQMPSTDGTAETLITSFSGETPFGTLPTRGNFFKLEATQDGLVTITCKPSTDNAQKLVFVEMDGENIAKATVNTSIWNDYYNYEVEAGKTYYVFQLSKSGNLSSFRYTFRGISFQSQILDEDAAYNPASMVGISALTLKRTLKKDKWNTIVLPVALTNAQLKAAFGDNVKLAELTGASENELTFSSVTETAANQPYMIYVDKDFSGEHTFTGISVASGTPSQTISGADFVGSYAAVTDIPEDSYFVQDNYLVKAGTGNKMKGTRAYFAVEGSNEVKSLGIVIDGSEATGIAEIVNSKLSNNKYYYNLAGQRMAQPTKGINIVSGKKVIVK